MKSGRQYQRPRHNPVRRLLPKISWLEIILGWAVLVFFLATLIADFWFMNEREAKMMDKTVSKGSGSESGAMLRIPTSSRESYGYWRQLACDFAELIPSDVLLALENKDPFGVRRFEKLLLDMETKLGRILSLQEIKSIFPCPESKYRLTLPDQRNVTRVEEFRNGTGFLFFQHLRKAGGTNFCTLATRNLPKHALPPYFCMPDMYWPNTLGAGYLHHWTNLQIIQQIQPFRVAGNEWDTFDPEHHFDLPAVFATSFRSPMDRALSQFRFECLENRGCLIKNTTEWWPRRRDLANIYLRTFADPSQTAGLVNIYRGASKDAARKRREFMERAMDTIVKFHLVTVMEWLAYAGPQVAEVLGFQELSALTDRVRPHIRQAPRQADGLEVGNALGARGVIEKNNKFYSNLLTPELHKQMSEDLALDEILTDVARRIFLEHLVCDDTDRAMTPKEST